MKKTAFLTICASVLFFCGSTSPLLAESDAKDTISQALESFLKRDSAIFTKNANERAQLWERWRSFLQTRPTRSACFEEFASLMRQILPRGEKGSASPKSQGDELRQAAGDPLWQEIRRAEAVDLVRKGEYEAAEEIFAQISEKSALDPVACAFYRAAALHQLLRRDECLATINDALERVDESSPRRFVALLRLMKRDLEALKEGSLDYIARKMKNSERLLDHGCADEDVQKTQQEIIAALDELIKQMEQEQQTAQASASPQMRPSSSPKEGGLRKMNGPGDVENKPVAEGGEWGNLPPKEREEALQQIGHDFPPHYRDAIEQYFKTMAEQE
ncbi:MAG: hypothetical protein Q4D38_11365 [Planctomycetia bacterium]|nr:hypothetical protein [Planctomycetia bacterium]